MADRFDFKRFSIRQGSAAMKVGFDGVLLGAWARVDGAARILDIGTGTGLVALMLAQRTEVRLASRTLGSAENRAAMIDSCRIDAVEIDADAVRDARANFEDSPWADRLRLFHGSIREYADRGGKPDESKPYDMIVCNPPFFSNGLPSDDDSRSIARHTGSLTSSDLFEFSAQHAGGALTVILPVDREADYRQDAAAHWQMHVRRRLLVRPNPNRPPKRVLLEFQGEKPTVRDCEVDDDEIMIETNQRHQYSDAFRKLTEAFYLKM